MPVIIALFCFLCRMYLINSFFVFRYLVKVTKNEKISCPVCLLFTEKINFLLVKHFSFKTGFDELKKRVNKQDSWSLWPNNEKWIDEIHSTLLCCTFYGSTNKLFQYLDIIILAVGNYSRAMWPNEGVARTSDISLQYQNIDCLTISSVQVSHQTVQNRFYWQ